MKLSQRSWEQVVVCFLLAAAVAGGAAGALGGQAQESAAPVAAVDPFIGTGEGPGGPVNLFPGATTPFGMTQLSPDTESPGYGYHYDQSTIQGFSLTHMSGVGCPNAGDVFFTATSGPVQTQLSEFQSPYFHNHESATPGYYQVLLSRFGINAELTATDRTGLARFTFLPGKPANVLVPISHTLNRAEGAQVQVVGDREISGYVENHVFCGNSQTYKVYFVMTFSRPFASFGTWRGERGVGSAKAAPSSRQEAETQHGPWIGAYASWPASQDAQTVTVKIGISYVDAAGARNNLQAESAAKDFDQVRADDRELWNKALSVIQVAGGTDTNRRIFYTSLYHSLLMPSIYSDADGRYLGFDNKVHHVESGHLVYCNYSGWDIYRSELPLLALIDPQRMQDMSQSVVLMYQQGGWIDRWPEANRYTNVMAGSPLTVMLSMAWLEGLHGFDINSAWQGMLLDATKAPPPHRHYEGQQGIEWINKLHFTPNDKVHYGSVSQLQEDCIAYASLYRLAKQLGKTDDAKMLYERALYYRNLFNPEDGFFRPRDSNGKWVDGFDPTNQDDKQGFIEGSGWHYQWFEPADLAWVVNAVGVDRFNHRLSNFFDYEKPGWFAQWYNPYNETDLEAPFVFNFSGQPWESQRVVRRVLKENYTTAPNGIPGNDDCGEMSSWAVLSMMGIYTVDPASLAYELVSPVFSKVVVQLHPPYSGKQLTIEASDNPEATPYIQSVKVNGQDHSQNWISFGDMAAGGDVQFVLGAEPNKSWGAAAQDAPPSLSQTEP